jgi:ABC-type nickel/cobalt efflux system permease component RcnA
MKLVFYCLEKLALSWGIFLIISYGVNTSWSSTTIKSLINFASANFLDSNKVLIYGFVMNVLSTLQFASTKLETKYTVIAQILVWCNSNWMIQKKLPRTLEWNFLIELLHFLRLKHSALEEFCCILQTNMLQCAKGNKNSIVFLH